jgi:hypothetical protein
VRAHSDTNKRISFVFNRHRSSLPLLDEDDDGSLLDNINRIFQWCRDFFIENSCILGTVFFLFKLDRVFLLWEFNRNNDVVQRIGNPEIYVHLTKVPRFTVPPQERERKSLAFIVCSLIDRTVLWKAKDYGFGSCRGSQIFRVCFSFIKFLVIIPYCLWKLLMCTRWRPPYNFSARKSAKRTKLINWREWLLYK